MSLLDEILDKMIREAYRAGVLEGIAITCTVNGMHYDQQTAEQWYDHNFPQTPIGNAYNQGHFTDYLLGRVLK